MRERSKAIHKPVLWRRKKKQRCAKVANTTNQLINEWLCQQRSIVNDNNQEKNINRSTFLLCFTYIAVRSLIIYKWSAFEWHQQQVSLFSLGHAWDRSWFMNIQFVHLCMYWLIDIFLLYEIWGTTNTTSSWVRMTVVLTAHKFHINIVLRARFFTHSGRRRLSNYLTDCEQWRCGRNDWERGGNSVAGT